MSFLREDRPELAGSPAQMALCSEPSANEPIERREGKGRVSVITKRRGKEFGTSVRTCNENIAANAPGLVPGENRPCQVGPPTGGARRR